MKAWMCSLLDIPVRGLEESNVAWLLLNARQWKI